MEKLFAYPTFNSPEHTELAEYIIDRSKQLFFDGGVNNIFSTTAVQSSIEFFNHIKKPVRILTAHYEKSDSRIQQLNTLFLRVSLTYFHNVVFTFATSTLSTKDFLDSAHSANLEIVLIKAFGLIDDLKDFAITSEGKQFLEQTSEYRSQCIFNLHSISLGVDSPKRFNTRGQINTSAGKKKEGCYIATMVYGSYDAPQVVALREFRDSKLKPYLIGRLFVHFYYTISPHLVEYLTPYPKIHTVIRKALSMTFKLKL